jgi:hypothetical protein
VCDCCQEILLKAGSGRELEFADFKVAMENALEVKDQRKLKVVFRDLDTFMSQGHELTEYTVLDVLQVITAMLIKATQPKSRALLSLLSFVFLLTLFLLFRVAPGNKAHGLLCIKGVTNLPQKVLDPTVYDAFLLLEDSWKGVSKEVENQVKAF